MIDRTTRILLGVGGALLLLALVIGGLSLFANGAPPPPTPAPPPTPPPTVTFAPTVTAVPEATVAQLDTPLPTDTPQPSDTPAPTPPPTDTAEAGSTPAPGPAAGAAAYLTPLGRPIVYAALGASDTVGVGATN